MKICILKIEIKLYIRQKKRININENQLSGEKIRKYYIAKIDGK